MGFFQELLDALEIQMDKNIPSYQVNPVIQKRKETTKQKQQQKNDESTVESKPENLIQTSENQLSDNSIKSHLLTSEDLRNAFVFSEIIGKPVSLRNRRRY